MKALVLAAALLVSCGGQRVVVVHDPPAPSEPARPSIDRPTAFDGALEGDRVAVPVRPASHDAACDVDPTLARLGPSCVRLRGVEARASGGAAPISAFDGDLCSLWNSGGFAPQSLTLDLGEATRITSIVLVPEMAPNGPAAHVVEISDDGRTFRRLGEVRAVMRTGEPIELPIPGGTTARLVRITSTESPSWIAWREIVLARC